MKTDYGGVGAVGDGFRLLRDEFDCVELSFNVSETDSDWSGRPHNHAGQGHEEVYYLVSGEATLAVEGKGLDLESNGTVRVSPEDARKLRNGPGENTFIIADAP